MHLKVFVKQKKTLKTLSSGQKTQKNPKKPKKPKKNQKNPLGWVFFKKTRVFSNPGCVYQRSQFRVPITVFYIFFTRAYRILRVPTFSLYVSVLIERKTRFYKAYALVIYALCNQMKYIVTREYGTSLWI